MSGFCPWASPTERQSLQSSTHLLKCKASSTNHTSRAGSPAVVVSANNFHRASGQPATLSRRWRPPRVSADGSGMESLPAAVVVRLCEYMRVEDVCALHQTCTTLKVGRQRRLQRRRCRLLCRRLVTRATAWLSMPAPHWMLYIARVAAPLCADIVRERCVARGYARLL